MAEKIEQPLTAFAQAIQDRKRKLHEFDVSGFFGIAGTPLPKVAIRRPTKGEQDRALVGAHQYVAERAGNVDGAKGDADMLQDAKAAFVAYEFCRDPKNPKYTLFPGPKWMCEHLAPEEIGVLINLGNEVRAKEAPSPIGVSDEVVEAYIRLCAEAAGAEVPGAVLAGVSREYLTHLVIMMALKLIDVRARLDTLVDEEPMPETQDQPVTGR